MISAGSKAIAADNAIWIMDGEDTDSIDSNADLVITGGTIELSGSGINYDGKLTFTGGTVIIDGKEVPNIPNQSTHCPDS